MSVSTGPTLERLAAQAEPIRVESVSDQLIESLKSWVLKGLIAPGEQLPPERELAATLKVSRSSLRQALKVLEVMGVLESRQGSGRFLTVDAETILRQPTDFLMPLRGVSLGEIFEARRAVEAEAASAAASRATKQDGAELQEILERMLAHLSYPTAYQADDVAFHRKIAQISGNGVFVWLIEMVAKLMADVWRERARQGNNTTLTFAEHEAIFRAIERQDADAAREAMLAHLTLAKFYSREPANVEFRVVGP